MRPSVFSQDRANPEDFIQNTARLINEQKASVIVEHRAYNPVEDSHDIDIFMREKSREDLSRGIKTNRHVYDYVLTDSEIERRFVRELDTGTEVEVWGCPLPRDTSLDTAGYPA